jgi:NAD-dependent dihydropyrimidine dehydrogenase PreA subunit
VGRLNTIIISLDPAASGGAADLARDPAAGRARAPGWNVVSCPPLYHLAEDSPLWAELAGLSGRRVLITDLHPRPLDWLLRKHGVAAEEIIYLDARTCATPEEALAALREAGGGAETPDQPGSWRTVEEPVTARWYPVVEGARCRNCGQCLQFCLFGVYALDAEGKVTVARPDECKPGCPACSRICPEGVIMFPLYEKDEAIAGAPGRRMAPDPAARRMYYQRTGLSCPACGRTAARRAADRGGEGEVCPECGAALGPEAAGEPEARPAAPETSGEVGDELDRLLGELDRLARRDS